MCLLTVVGKVLKCVCSVMCLLISDVRSLSSDCSNIKMLFNILSTHRPLSVDKPSSNLIYIQIEENPLD